MPKERPCVLSIAGFDPSGGAGILADIKTFEQHKVQGMGVVTGLTFQNDSEFEGVKWIETAEIEKQIEILCRKFKFKFVKIGMIKDLNTVNEIISFCRLQTANCRLVWDPIVKASAGFEIHKKVEKEKLIEICKNIFLITPNMDEIKILTGEQDEMKAAKELSKHCNVFLKGGHSKDKKGRDYLFLSPSGGNHRLGAQLEGEDYFSFRPKKIATHRKHGSGCVLSSSIAANLANGLSLQRSCLKAKDYVTKFLRNNKTLLGHHKT